MVSTYALPLRGYLLRNAVRWSHECTGSAGRYQRRDHAWWLDRLRGLPDDPCAMASLRSLIARRELLPWLATDQEIVLRAALALECGELGVWEEEEPKKAGGGGGGEPAAAKPAVPAAAPAPPWERRAAPRPEPETLSPGASHGAIAESHRAAARLGVALCEECMKQAEEGK